MPSQLKCPKCACDMEQGYVLEIGDGNFRSAARWIAGPPERSMLFGTKVKDREQHAIQSFRCTRCGYLESYAPGEPPGAA